MTPVGGSRHYDGGGLGPEGGWGCPSCGADNQGPMAQGCTVCGAGRPGRHVGTTPPPPPAPPAAEPPPPAARQGDLATAWAEEHPEATVEDAYRTGYFEGIRAARRQQQQAAQTKPTAFSPDHLINRTMVAALELFRDQVLADDPEETRTGEWLTAHQATALIHQIQRGIHASEEPAHA